MTHPIKIRWYQKVQQWHIWATITAVVLFFAAFREIWPSIRAATTAAIIVTVKPAVDKIIIENDSIAHKPILDALNRNFAWQSEMKTDVKDMKADTRCLVNALGAIMTPAQKKAAGWKTKTELTLPSE